eukprot:CAMPEP_0175048958 /NCGR_PEP_ID=MMETSP0052_2-20121109/6479_1 /TAXON_ID=51329 ORGANISM="Polytomella parva, Strain SAG 63-3" /NCGR_SAMPLE_ID=MMETSP0052_2 /ASSEMBLY_ACC=CAM_ASM_000194 /LENGTH=1129 /DNA_ID=CAMNT_0016313081 /DNA_START=311 /DNA_END=3700 /DNA_ORIENTATION=-
MGDYTNRLNPTDFESLNGERNDLKLSYFPEMEAYFDDAKHYEEIRSLCGFTHPILQDRSLVFRSLNELRDHIEHTHHRSFCDLCLKDRQVFVSEQILYNPSELQTHEDRGDVTGPLANCNFKGHPRCQFCRIRFYDSNELFRHMETTHEHCFLCRRREPKKFVYYDDYDELHEHFCSAHHCCQFQSCIDQHFIVFETEHELRAHTVKDHADELPKLSGAQRRTMLTIPLDRGAYSGPGLTDADATGGRDRGGGGDGYDDRGSTMYDTVGSGSAVQDSSGHIVSLTFTPDDFPSISGSVGAAGGAGVFGSSVAGRWLGASTTSRRGGQGLNSHFPSLAGPPPVVAAGGARNPGTVHHGRAAGGSSIPSFHTSSSNSNLQNAAAASSSGSSSSSLRHSLSTTALSNNNSNSISNSSSNRNALNNPASSSHSASSSSLLDILRQEARPVRVLNTGNTNFSIQSNLSEQAMPASFRSASATNNRVSISTANFPSLSSEPVTTSSSSSSGQDNSYNNNSNKNKNKSNANRNCNSSSSSSSRLSILDGVEAAIGMSLLAAAGSNGVSSNNSRKDRRSCENVNEEVEREEEEEEEEEKEVALVELKTTKKNSVRLIGNAAGKNEDNNRNKKKENNDSHNSNTSTTTPLSVSTSSSSSSLLATLMLEQEASGSHSNYGNYNSNIDSNSSNNFIYQRPNSKLSSSSRKNGPGDFPTLAASNNTPSSAAALPDQPFSSSSASNEPLTTKDKLKMELQRLAQSQKAGKSANSIAAAKASRPGMFGLAGPGAFASAGGSSGLTGGSGSNSVLPSSDFPSLSQSNSNSSSNSNSKNKTSSTNNVASGSSLSTTTPSSMSKDIERALIESIKHAMDSAKSGSSLSAFKEQTGAFREGRMTAEAYFRHLIDLGLMGFAPAIAGMCPDPNRRGDLRGAIRNFLRTPEAQKPCPGWVPPEAMLAELNAMGSGCVEVERVLKGLKIGDREGEVKGKKEEIDEEERKRRAKKAEKAEKKNKKAGLGLGGGIVINGGGGGRTKEGLEHQEESEENIEGLEAEAAETAAAIAAAAAAADFPALPSSNNSSWTCGTCTLMNGRSTRACAACGAHRNGSGEVSTGAGSTSGRVRSARGRGVKLSIQDLMQMQ